MAAAAEDAEYEYVADGAAREAGEAQTLGPATEEQAAELRDGELPDAAGAFESGDCQGTTASRIRCRHLVVARHSCCIHCQPH